MPYNIGWFVRGDEPRSNYPRHPQRPPCTNHCCLGPNGETAAGPVGRGDRAHGWRGGGCPSGRRCSNGVVGMGLLVATSARCANRDANLPWAKWPPLYRTGHVWLSESDLGHGARPKKVALSARRKARRGWATLTVRKDETWARLPCLKPWACSPL